jgi:hypothetical protein
MNLYRDGQLVEAYSGSRDFAALTQYLVKNTAPPVPSAPIFNADSEIPVMPVDQFIAKNNTPPAPLAPILPILNPDGKVAVLTIDSFNATLAQGPAFVNFYPAQCGLCSYFASMWKQLAAKTQGRLTVAEVDCGRLTNRELCAAHTTSLNAGPQLIFYHPSSAAGATYTGRCTLAKLETFAELRGVPAPLAVQLTPQTSDTIMAASVVVLAVVGSATRTNVVARINAIALEWQERRPAGTLPVQFAWQDPRSDRMFRPVQNSDVDAGIIIMVHENQNQVRRPLCSPIITCISLANYVQ